MVYRGSITDRILAKYIMRESPDWYAIREVVADFRGNIYARTRAAGGKGDVVATYRELYGETWIDPEPQGPVEQERNRMGKAFGFERSSTANNRPYADLG